VELGPLRHDRPLPGFPRAPPAMWGRAIMVAAAGGKHTGKTSVSMALTNGLRRRFPSVGYMKPVGQEHVVDGSAKIDKDVFLARQHFSMTDPPEAMSPVILDRGVTKSFIDGALPHASLVGAIRSGFRTLSARHDFVVVEGTGHVGVGSVVGLSNPRVAALLGLDMVLVVNGGIGRAVDEVELSRALCDAHGVRVRGVVMNRVLPAKMGEIRGYAERWLTQAGLPLLGCIPDSPSFDKPRLSDLLRTLRARVLVGGADEARSYSTHEFVGTSVKRFEDKLAEDPAALREAFLLVHHTRHDVLEAVLNAAAEGRFAGGLVLTGSPPRTDVEALLRGHPGASALDVLDSAMTSTQAMEGIKACRPKLRPGESRTDALCHAYAPYLDWNALVGGEDAPEPFLRDPAGAVLAPPPPAVKAA